MTGCRCDAEPELEQRPSPPPSASERPVLDSGLGPATLFVPDSGDFDLQVAPGVARRQVPGIECPSDMVAIGHDYCIDRYEVRLADADGRGVLSPYYHPTVTRTRSAHSVWELERKRMGEPSVQLLPLPEPPAFQLSGAFRAKAESHSGVVPHGYLSRVAASAACQAAGKRLCSDEEWTRACRGEDDTQFPYGDVYVAGLCNVAGGRHPAKLLHGNASIGHLDPRLNQFSHEGKPLLHRTGANEQCKSRWGADAVYDMVGNLDEWVDDSGGIFRGGFYARNSKVGCDARISSHPAGYFDYSLGTRCCR